MEIAGQSEAFLVKYLRGGGGAFELVFLTSSQGTWMRLVQEPHVENCELCEVSTGDVLFTKLFPVLGAK